ncbi:MAG: hypothetical protein ACAH59_07715 [Pseudobdellovibrionaceae bacterium]
MTGQDNKPNNQTFNSIGRPDRMGERGQTSQAQEYINETAEGRDEEEAPSTAQSGKQPRVKGEKPL